MDKGFQYRILVVDDEPTIRDTSVAILGSQGYEVRTAADGFEGLVELRRSLPDLIISDLRMPDMSGFEFLSVVRRRFSHIPVIAISGQYDSIAPPGVIADWFFSKGAYQPTELFRKIAELIDKSPVRPHLARADRAPVWVRKGSEGHFVITCTECLRSFPVLDEEATGELRKTVCPFCESTVNFLADPESLESARH